MTESAESRIVETSDAQRVKELRRQSPESIAQIVTELQRIKETSVDLVVPASHLSVVQDEYEEAHVRTALRVSNKIGGDTAFADIELGHTYEIGRVAQEQLADKMGIPQRYADRMFATAPELYAENVNTWMQRAEANYLLRTVDGRARAFLSDRFRTLDNFDYMLNIGGVLQEVGATITSLTLSEERLYVRAIMPEWGVAIDNGRGGGDVLIPGFVGSNSDVGRGGLNASSWGLRTICMNGMQQAKTLHTVHIGGKRETGLQLTAETQEAQDRAFWLEVRDLVRATFDKTLFAELMDSVNAAARTMLLEPVKAVEAVAKTFQLSEEQSSSVMAYLMAPAIPETESGTLWGLINGVTQLEHSADAEEVDRLERIGGELLASGRTLAGVAS